MSKVIGTATKCVLGITAACLFAFAAPVTAARDCGRAKSNAEKMLCSNPRLAQADQRMALAYRTAIRQGGDPKLLMETQRTWIEESRDLCNDADCMLKAYEERIAQLEGR